MRRLAACLALALLPVLAGRAQEAPPGAAPAVVVEPALVPATRSGREIYRNFREGLADPDCSGEHSSARWRRHYAAAPVRMANESDDVLALFGYVVDSVRAAGLPTEYALIPFVESGYKPGARSSLGPAGMWQMIRLTARAHRVPMHAGYDGRLSPVESTRAAVRYLKTLHGMFAGDWRLAAMAYNAGEYRVFSALRRSGQVARSADPEKLTTLSGITRAYVRKLHALSCLFDDVDDGEQWLQALDRQVPVLEAVELPPGVRELGAWASANGRDPARVRRLNPSFANGRLARGERERQVLVPSLAPAMLATEADAVPPVLAPETLSSATPPPVAAAALPPGAGPDAAGQAH